MIIRLLMIMVGVERMPCENLSEVFSYSAPVSMILLTSARSAPGRVRRAFGAVLFGEGGAPGRASSRTRNWRRSRRGWRRSAPGSRPRCRACRRRRGGGGLLRRPRCSWPSSGKNWIGDVDLAGELLLELLQLLAEVEAVGADKIREFDDLDGRVLELIGRLDRPVRREEARARRPWAARRTA